MKQSPTRAARNGAAAVELAVVLPVFLLIVFGIVELGRAFMAQHMLSEASRMGARRAIVAGASDSEIKNIVEQFCLQTLNVDDSKVKIKIEVLRRGVVDDDDDDEAEGGTAKLSEAKSGDMCSVTVSIPFKEVSFLPPLFLQNSNFSKTCVMERE